MKRFPKDCLKSCKYYREYDMSVDDYVGICYKLNLQCDLCDEDYCYYLCPLNKYQRLPYKIKDYFKRVFWLIKCNIKSLFRSGW